MPRLIIKNTTENNTVEGKDTVVNSSVTVSGNVSNDADITTLHKDNKVKYIFKW